MDLSPPISWLYADAFSGPPELAAGDFCSSWLNSSLLGVGASICTPPAGEGKLSVLLCFPASDGTNSFSLFFLGTSCFAGVLASFVSGSLRVSSIPLHRLSLICPVPSKLGCSNHSPFHFRNRGSGAYDPWLGVGALASISFLLLLVTLGAESRLVRHDFFKCGCKQVWQYPHRGMAVARVPRLRAPGTCPGGFSTTFNEGFLTSPILSARRKARCGPRDSSMRSRSRAPRGDGGFFTSVLTTLVPFFLSLFFFFCNEGSFPSVDGSEQAEDAQGGR